MVSFRVGSLRYALESRRESEYLSKDRVVIASKCHCCIRMLHSQFTFRDVSLLSCKFVFFNVLFSRRNVKA